MNEGRAPSALEYKQSVWKADSFIGGEEGGGCTKGLAGASVCWGDPVVQLRNLLSANWEISKR